ncbi:MAG: hypothetical protein AB7G11_07580 [Phycisphaerales bacterium]
MAGRTSVGVGWGISFSLISVVALGLFVTTVIFLAQKQNATKKFTELQTQIVDFVKDGERERDDIKQLKEAARRKNQSLVAFLMSSQGEMAQLATGSPKISPEDLQKTLDALPGGKSPNMLQKIRDLDAQLGLERKRSSDADAARQVAQTDLEKEVARVKALEDAHNESLTALNQQIDTYRGEVDKYAQEVGEAKKSMSEHEEKVRADALDSAAQLNARITELEREALLNRQTISRLQTELKGRSLKPGDEYALVDAEVIGIDPAENNAFLNVGSRQKVRVGLSFEVYSEPTAMRPDPTTGDYPAGKASLEIIRVDRDTCTARIVREKKGNPVVRGDVVANALYDPKKVYTMLVFGNFDVNQDGFATANEANDVKSLIAEWGGKSVDELSGEVDFLVLGQRPVIPPSPPAGAPNAVIEEWVRVKSLAERYDDLFNRATATSIPVLNENRLYTLIGKRLGH